tara:strand:- start:2015 stop:2671 length:657 start_codon:yes stop_codon:yes gene_type:complete
MHNNVVDNLNAIEFLLKGKMDNRTPPLIIAISKTFPMSKIFPLINIGHKHFGENKILESLEKWKDIKETNKEIKLHMVGKIQSNKVKFLLPLFDYIHSLDSLKLARKISEVQLRFNKKPKIFIQVNIGNEIQKSGIDVNDVESFYKSCTQDFGLDIIGLMCLPPVNKNSSLYFKEMRKLAESIQVKELSMGMSNDYLEASQNGSTFIRIGSKIFGARD